MYYFRTDGNENIGLGHMMRCCAIAEELAKYGNDVMFVIAPDSTDSPIIERGFKYYRLKDTSCIGWSSEEFCKWIALKNDSSPVVILDSYRVDYLSMDAIKNVAKLVYIDDLAAFDYPVNAIINFNIEANKQMYTAVKEEQRKLYLGPLFFPSRSEFSTFNKSYVNEKVVRVLLTCSSTDPVGAIELLISNIDPMQYKEIEFNILVGKFFSNEYVNKLKTLSGKYSNVRLLPWGQNMAELLFTHDLLIAPGSTIMLESFIVGTPCLSFYFVDNQIGLCKYASERNMACSIGDITKKENLSKIRDLFNYNLNYVRRKEQFERFSKEIDNKGCTRIRIALESV